MATVFIQWCIFADRIMHCCGLGTVVSIWQLLAQLIYLKYQFFCLLPSALSVYTTSLVLAILIIVPFPNFIHSFLHLLLSWSSCVWSLNQPRQSGRTEENRLESTVGEGWEDDFAQPIALHVNRQFQHDLILMDVKPCFSKFVMVNKRLVVDQIIDSAFLERMIAWIVGCKPNHPKK